MSAQRKPLTFKRFKRILLQPVEYLFVRCLFFGVRMLPAGVVVWIGGVFGAAAFSWLRIRRRVAMKNLGLAFPDLSTGERVKIGCKAYANLGRSMMEILLLQKIDAQYISTHLRVEGDENLRRCLENGKGALAVTGHFGSWELMAAAFPKRGFPVSLLVGEQKNKQVDTLFNSLRTRHELELIPLDMALRGILRALKRNRLIALLGDQEARHGAGIEITFFGRPTLTYPGVALFAIKAGAPVLCPFIVRQGTGLDHLITMEPHLEFTPSGDREEDIRILTQLHSDRLEAWIRKYPDHWFWGHKRWKSQGIY
ncbi:MAG: lysophospholipid acyltransferase family protein [Planctomycetota bacterium]